MGNIDFNAESHERSEDAYENFAGKFVAVIEDTKDGRDEEKGWLMLKLVIKGPTHQNRILWHYLNLWHENPNDSEKEQTTRHIARDELYDICQAIGKGAVGNDEELRYHEIGIEVKIAKNKDGTEQSRIKSFFSKDKVPQGQATGFAPKPAASGSTKAPWDK